MYFFHMYIATHTSLKSSLVELRFLHPKKMGEMIASQSTVKAEQEEACHTLGQVSCMQPVPDPQRAVTSCSGLLSKFHIVLVSPRACVLPPEN